MRDWAKRVSLLAVCFGLPFGVWFILIRPRSQHLLYPPYSSLRADAKGTSVWYESLLRDPGLSTLQNFRPFSLLEVQNSAVLVLGVDLQNRAGELDRLLTSCESIAQTGNRVLVALDPQNTPKFLRAAGNLEALKKRGLDPVWRKDDFLLQPTSNWKRLVAKPEIIELHVGKGSIVLSSMSDLFTNREVARRRETSRLVELLGSARTVVFDETHLGITETGSVLGLARHYQLQGFLLGLLIFCVLFVWRASSAFPSRRAEKSLTNVADPLDGFSRLLERSLPKEKLIAECVRVRLQIERSPQRREILQSASFGRDTLQDFIDLQKALRTKQKSTSI